uniref:AlNc14C322G10607 protein n=1 Tax=Albugo laibachii Nc14 TaxID=890382 RepID=F0WWJ6_9STRA|nr:AlNc14C322G10607 [Albugo laibachii Nc14]|eukprot:CCA25819.1 AlNc14C322G10607 [Albugo laibachii Nc14]
MVNIASLTIIAMGVTQFNIAGASTSGSTVTTNQNNLRHRALSPKELDSRRFHAISPHTAMLKISHEYERANIMGRLPPELVAAGNKLILYYLTEREITQEEYYEIEYIYECFELKIPEDVENAISAWEKKE